MSQEIERKFLVSGDYKSQAFDQSRIVGDQCDDNSRHPEYMELGLLHIIVEP